MTSLAVLAGDPTGRLCTLPTMQCCGDLRSTSSLVPYGQAAHSETGEITKRPARTELGADYLEKEKEQLKQTHKEIIIAIENQVL